MHLPLGTLLRGGAYKIENVLGQGSFGITYLATHTSLAKKYAIKEFFMKGHNQREDDGTLLRMAESSFSYNYCKKFQKEALNLARLEHSNIVQVTDLFEENGTFYYVMEYIEGQNLDDYIKSHRISEQEAVGIITQAASALEYMHVTHHMLHLDLKPSNIMRRESDGKVFLIDFGLSKHYDKDGHPETSTTVGLGTPGYAPIEQANQARNGEFRPTIDIYALGATLYKLLTGERPPEASVLISDPYAHIRVMQSKGVNPELMGFVVKSMLPNVNNRIANTTQFKQMLASIKLNVNNPANDETQKTDKKTIINIIVTIIIAICFIAAGKSIVRMIGICLIAISAALAGTKSGKKKSGKKSSNTANTPKTTTDKTVVMRANEQTITDYE